MVRNEWSPNRPKQPMLLADFVDPDPGPDSVGSLNLDLDPGGQK
jgi:hypothetical protein